MADLPVKLWHLIFYHLDLIDLSSCAQVSKTLYSALKAYQIQEIAFTRRVYQWFHCATPVRSNYKHRVEFAKASILERSSFNFGHLKRLKIGRLSSIDDLNVINRFVHLEELDIDLKNYQRKNTTLRLANLRLLYVFVPMTFPVVELDTPLLAKVGTFSLKKLDFLYPESIRCIHTFSHDGKLWMFWNLECLVITNNYNLQDHYFFHNWQNFQEFCPLSLKKLKEINFYYEKSHENFDLYERRNMKNFKTVIQNILDMKRPGLQVLWYGVQVTDANLLTEYELLREIRKLEYRLAAFYLRHHEKLNDNATFRWSILPFSLLDDLPWIESYFKIDLNASLIKNEAFISKFIAKCSFRSISVDYPIVERDLLMEFIANSPNLATLKFSNSGLDQSFFDRMAVTIRLNGIRLKRLQFEKSPLLNFINYDFVRKLPDLVLFRTDRRLPNELVLKLLTHPMLESIKFSPDRVIWYHIERVSSTRYFLNGRPRSLQELKEEFEVQGSTVVEVATTIMKRFNLW